MPLDQSHHPVRAVLIVDTVVSEGMTLDLLCRSLGVETICTTGAAEVADILAQIRPAAVIAALGADGVGCLLQIAEHTLGVPIMVVCGSETPLLEAASEIGENCGLSDLVCVSKPVDINTLRAFVASAGLVFRPSQWDLH